MNYNQLGKSDLKVSEVSFGCMSLKGEKSQNIALLHKAMDMGFNYFDTADLYDAGENEKIVGEAFKGKRQDIVLATKVGNEMRADGSGWDWNPRKQYILTAVEKSLSRLQTDYIDLYQLHGGTIEDPIDEVIEAFEILKQQGKIRAYGLSSIRPNVIREYLKKSNIASVMMQYSLLDRRPEEHCLDELANKGVSAVVRGAYAKGLLLDKPLKEYLDWSVGQVEEVRDMLQRLGNDLNEIRGMALSFPLRHSAVISVVSGIRTEEQLLETVQALSKVDDVKEKVAKLMEVLPVNFYKEHR
ncbi:aldo/keto reductase [Echinicola sediminis]